MEVEKVLEKFRDAIIGEIRKNSRNSKLKSEDSLRDLSLQLNTMNKRIWNWVIRFLLNFGDYNSGVTKIPTEKEAENDWEARFKKGVEDFVGGVDTEIVVRQGTWLWSGWKNELKKRGISYHRSIEVFKLHSDGFFVRA